MSLQVGEMVLNLCLPQFHTTAHCDKVRLFRPFSKSFSLFVFFFKHNISMHLILLAQNCCKLQNTNITNVIRFVQNKYVWVVCYVPLVTSYLSIKIEQNMSSIFLRSARWDDMEVEHNDVIIRNGSGRSGVWETESQTSLLCSCS